VSVEATCLHSSKRLVCASVSRVHFPGTGSIWRPRHKSPGRQYRNCRPEVHERCDLLEKIVYLYPFVDKCVDSRLVRRECVRIVAQHDYWGVTSALLDETNQVRGFLDVSSKVHQYQVELVRAQQLLEPIAAAESQAASTATFFKSLFQEAHLGWIVFDDQNLISPVCRVHNGKGAKKDRKNTKPG
jgi:hypothetical protein